MNDIKDARFFKGGRAKFTVDNGKGDHYTYLIGHSNPNQPLFVSLLTGKDNDSSYTYMGILDPYTNVVKLTTKSRYSEGCTPLQVIRWAIRQISLNKPLPEGYSVFHAGKCCRCGRTLTTLESCEQGIGPECIKKGW